VPRLYWLICIRHCEPVGEAIQFLPVKTSPSGFFLLFRRGFGLVCVMLAGSACIISGLLRAMPSQ
ncbi:MAG: hypothetical protein LBR34_07655, partial [Prevotella sp.]|nr:hypothetical protein [Prevotella sp.]